MKYMLTGESFILVVMLMAVFFPVLTICVFILEWELRRLKAKPNTTGS